MVFFFQKKGPAKKRKEKFNESRTQDGSGYVGHIMPGDREAAPRYLYNRQLIWSTHIQ